MSWKCSNCGYSTNKIPAQCPKCGNELWQYSGLKNRRATTVSARGPKGKVV